jgi:hypothetical protein
LQLDRLAHVQSPLLPGDPGQPKLKMRITM